MSKHLLLFLVIVTLRLPAADGRGESWVRGPMVEVQADHAVKAVDEFGGFRPIGHPAFRQLTIRKGEKKDHWIVSGTVCSTNSGILSSDVAIYVLYPGEHSKLVALSNLKGEVLFSVSPVEDAERKPIVPTHIYLASHPINSASLKGQTLRQYRLRATE